MKAIRSTLLLLIIFLMPTSVPARNIFENFGGWVKKKTNEVGRFFSDPVGLKESAKIANEAISGLPGGQRNIQTAIQLDRIKRKEDLIRLQVVDCVGTFKLLARLQLIDGEDIAWETRVSSFRSIGHRPVPPVPPIRGDMSRKKFNAAKKQYDKDKSAYARNLKLWNAKLAKHLSDNALVLNPNFSGPGRYTFRVIVVPEDTDPAGWQGDWKIRLAATQDRKKGEPHQFKLIEIERADYPKLQAGTPISPMNLFFNVRRIE